MSKGNTWSMSIFYRNGDKECLTDVRNYVRDGSILEVRCVMNDPEMLIVNLESIQCIYIKSNRNE